MQTVSIVGFGRFGKTLYRLLKDDFEISIFDTNKEAFASYELDESTKVLDEISEIYKYGDAENPHTVFLAVPIDIFDEVIAKHSQYFNDHTILVDVLSVKTHAKKVFDKYLEDSSPGPQAILTHPMFGPDSSKDGFEGLPIVLDQYKAADKVYKFWKDFFESKKLEIVELTPDEHDKMAADSQGVTHFIGRLLDEFELEATSIDTLGAKKLQEVMEQTCNDTWQLFVDLQNFNPFTKDMRLRFGRAYDKIYNKLLPNRINPKKIVFGIQGGKGSFNEQALSDYVKRHDIKNYEVKYLYTTENVLSQLHKGNIDRGQFAIHNSTGGIVSETIQALSRYKFEIVEEFAIIIAHYLMKKPQAEIKDIDTIMTHPQVLKQCKANIAKKYSHLEAKSGEDELIDHAKVAQALSDDELGDNIAVMGPQILSEIYDLDVIEGDLQDNDENYTSFLMVKRRNE
jgi:prephenate dehydrogenase